MNMKYVSARGDILPLTDNKYFHLMNIDGQTSYEGGVSRAKSNDDGDTITNISAEARPLLVSLRIKSGVDVEAAKREILKVVKPKQYGSLVWEQNGRALTITGRVTSFDMPRWQNGVIAQIGLDCEQPFWEDIDFVIQQISEAVDLHYFVDSPVDMLYFTEDGIAFGEYDVIRTKDFHNAGDVAVGMEISIVALDTVTNPIIYNQDGDFFGVGYESRPLVMAAGDNVVITTHKGNKVVTLNGVNIYDKIKPNSKWLQLEAGDNTFSINSEDVSKSNMSFSLIYKQRYV